MNSPLNLAGSISPTLNRIAFANTEEADAKIYIMGGDFPTETEIYNMTFHDELDTEATGFLKDNTNILGVVEKRLEFKYEKNIRTIKPITIGSVELTLLNDHLSQSSGNKTTTGVTLQENFYAIIVFDYTDVTRNAVLAERPIIVTPLCGKEYTNSIQLDYTDEQLPLLKDEVISFRTADFKIIDGYKDGDEPLMALDPDKVGETDENGDPYLIQVGTKAGFYLNKHLTEFVSEGYRRSLVQPKMNTLHSAPWQERNETLSFRFDQNNYSINENSVYFVNGVKKLERDIPRENAYLINDSLKFILDLMNEKAREGTFPKFAEINPNYKHLCNEEEPPNPDWGEVLYMPNADYAVEKSLYEYYLAERLAIIEYIDKIDFNMYFIVKAIFQDTYPELKVKALNAMRDTLGISQSVIDNALKCILPIPLDQTNWTSTFDKDQQLLNVVYNAPCKLTKGYQKSIHNPQNEQLHIYIQGGLNKFDYSGLQTYGLSPQNMVPNTFFTFANKYYNIHKAPGMGFFRKLEDIKENKPDSEAKIFTMNLFRTVSIGLNADNNDIGLNTTEKINYIDKLTFVLDVPNKF